MIIEAPFLEACGECWMPVEGGVRSCECEPDVGVHRWQARAGYLCVAHPAIATPFTARFAYPIDSARLLRLAVRIRRALRRLAVDPREPTARWWLQPDSTVPEDPVPDRP